MNENKKAPAVNVRFGGLTLTFRFVLEPRKELADLIAFLNGITKTPFGKVEKVESPYRVTR